MKSSIIRYPLLLLVIASTLMVAACKKDDELPDPVPTPPETSITFNVTEAGNAKSGVFVGITLNPDDRDNGVFLRTGTTPSTGRYKFSNLTADTYYYSLSYSSNGTTYTRSGGREIAANARVTVDVAF